MAGELRHAEITGAILKAFYHVYNTLGYGFLEKVYENALAQSLRKLGLRVEQQVPVSVFFEGEAVGQYFADLPVEGVVIVEIKAAEALGFPHEAQLINYLKATRISVGLLLNFGPKPDFVRKVC